MSRRSTRDQPDGTGKTIEFDFFFFQTPYIFVGCNSLHPEELAPHAQNNECSYWCLQIWLRILHNWHFLESFVQTPKNCSSKTFIKYIFAQPAKIKLHPDQIFLHHAKLQLLLVFRRGL